MGEGRYQSHGPGPLRPWQAAANRRHSCYTGVRSSMAGPDFPSLVKRRGLGGRGYHSHGIPVWGRAGEEFILITPRTGYGDVTAARGTIVTQGCQSETEGPHYLLPGPRRRVLSLSLFLSPASAFAAGLSQLLRFFVSNSPVKTCCVNNDFPCN